jgi:hypothetical protein
MLVKLKPTNNPWKIRALVNTSSPLIPSQDPSKAKNAKESTNSEEKDSKGNKDKLLTNLQPVALAKEQPLQKKQ